MRTRTEDFKNSIKEFGRELDVVISYSTGDETETLTNEDIFSVSLHYEGGLLKSVMRQLDIVSTKDIPVGTYLNVTQFGVKVRNNEQAEDYRENYDYIDFGNYYVYSSEKQEDTKSYKIVCYDKMLNSMKDYISITQSFPMTLDEFINNICNQIGLTFSNYGTTYPNYNRIINSDIYEGINYKYRDVFDDIAQATAGIICINENDELEIRYPNSQMRSKNLLNINDGYQLGYISSSNVYTPDTKNALFNQKIYVEHGKTYTFSVNTNIDNMVISYFDDDDTFRGRQKVSGTNKVTYTVANNVGYIRYCINYDNSTTFTDALVEQLEPMAELGTERTEYEPYIISQLETFNEEYLKDANVSFNKKYGPINSIVLSRAAESDNVYLRDDESIELNGLCEIKITDNQLMNQNDRADYLPAILDKLDGLEYYEDDFESTGITYLDVGDMYNIVIGDITYPCLMLNDDITISQGLKESIYSKAPKGSVTDYSKADKTDRRLNETWLMVDKQNGTIEGLARQISDVEDDLGNVYTKDEVNNFISSAETGLTNTFSEAGGANMLRNTTFSSKEVLETGQEYEYWFGSVERLTNTSSKNGYSILLKSGTLYQEQNVANDPYTLSFMYRVTNPLATVKVKINDKEYVLDETRFTLFQTGIDGIDPINITSNTIRVSFISDLDDACEIYDIMLNSGTIKLAYSQNPNEVVTNTVNIQKGITITSSTSEIKFTANNDGIRTKTLNNDVITEFTDKGMTTKEATITDQALIVGILRQRVGDQVWDSLI